MPETTRRVRGKRDKEEESLFGMVHVVVKKPGQCWEKYWLRKPDVEYFIKGLCVNTRFRFPMGR